VPAAGSPGSYVCHQPRPLRHDANYAPPSRYDPPRNRIWWIVRAFVDTEDPVDWLLEQRAAGRRWTAGAKQLGCELDNVRLSRERRKRE